MTKTFVKEPVVPDLYVEVGPMSTSKDPNKVATSYATSAKKTMRDAAMKSVRGASGYTPDKVGNPKGFYIDMTLTEIEIGTYQGQPSVTCKATGVVATHPEKRWLTQSLTGKTTLGGGASPRDVQDCIKEVVTAMMTKDVIPFLKKQPAP